MELYISPTWHLVRLRHQEWLGTIAQTGHLCKMCCPKVVKLNDYFLDVQDQGFMIVEGDKLPWYRAVAQHRSVVIRPFVLIAIGLPGATVKFCPASTGAR